MSKHELKVAAIIQARMRSTRLPGKVLKPVAGQPLLWHVVERLKRSKLINTICVATSVDQADDPLVHYANELDVTVVRGDEDNVLSRYVLAAQELDADIIVRVTADAPLVDPEFVDFLIAELIKHRADFVMLKPGVTCIHEGADPMTRRSLEKLSLEAGRDPMAREHVSSYFKHHPGFVNIAEIELPEKWQFKGARVSIDTPADVTFIETVYERLHAQAGMASLTDLVALLRRQPELLNINAHVQQKSATAASGTVIVRCDGGHKIGMGHVRRCLSLARQLRDNQGFGVRFAMIEDETANACVQAEGYEVDLVPADANEIEALINLTRQHTPVAVVMDIRTHLSATSVLRLRGEDTLVALIDDGGVRRLSADACFYPPVPQVYDLNWTAVEHEPFVGWEFVILGHQSLPPKLAPGNTPRLLVTMGGSDPMHMTVPVASALAELGSAIDVTVVIGPAAGEGIEEQLADRAPLCSIVRNPGNLPELMAAADIAVTSFGVTAYELAALGVPSFYVGLTDDHVRSAQAFEQAGMGVSLGTAQNFTSENLKSVLADLLAHPSRLRAMSAAGRMNVDCRGAERVAAHIGRMVEERRQALSQPMILPRQATA